MKKILYAGVFALFLSNCGGTPKCTDAEVNAIVPALTEATAAISNTLTQAQKDALKGKCDAAKAALNDNTNKACTYEDKDKKTNEITVALIEKQCTTALK